MNGAAVPSEVEQGPDPEGARVRFERFVEQGGLPPEDPAGRRLLAAILSSGTFLPELLLADVTGWAALRDDPWLSRPKPAPVIFAELQSATRDAGDFADFKRRLRLVRRREMLRLGARELGWGTTEEVAAELSGFADACLELSHRYCERALRADYGTPELEAPPSEITTSGDAPSLVVISMGKLGGQELNFSSDVDLIYFYATDAGRVVRTDAAGNRVPGTRSLHQYFVELSRRITEAIEEVTAHGFIFRVDLRLRPEGRGGPLCNSLAAAERYYETFGRTWERQALLRARPCAGDLALGARLLQMLDPFIYPRHIAPGMVDEIRALRAQFRPRQDAQQDGQPGGPHPGFDVKLGSGGIRDVELVVQTLQLLHGGQRLELRGRSTPRGLRRMEVAGLLSDREARTLVAAYRFWRQIEHRLQLQDNAQTQLIPGDVGARTLLARRLGFPTVEAFDLEVQARRREVSAVAETFEAQDSDVPPAVLRLLAPSLERPESQTLLAELGFVDLEASADLIETAGRRLSPALVTEAIASPDPDRALANFRDLILRGGVGLLALWRDDARLLRTLATLFGVSERLSRLLVDHPVMWDPLMDGLGEPVRDQARLESALRSRLPGDPDEEAAARSLRRFVTEETLRVGVHDVAGNLTASEVAGQLTDLAEVCLRQGVPPLLQLVAARHGWPDTGFTILGLGSLGAREMRYGSDLDLVFLYAHEGATSTGVGHQEFFTRLARRVINAFGARLEEGRLYDIDTRLRPSGEQGLLVTSHEAFARYHQDEAAEWERVALLRARIVFTTAAPPQRGELEELLARITYQRPFDARNFAAALVRVRQRVESERGRVPAGSRHLRFDPGGIMDLEFLAALGQLAGGATDAALRTTDTAAVLARLSETGWPDTLLSDFSLLRTLAMRMRLLRDRPEDVVGPADLTPLARSLETEPTRLATDLDRAMQRVRTSFLDHFSS